MQVGLVLATCMVLLLLTYHRDRQLLAAGLMILVMFIYQTRFTVRPDLFSFFFFAMFIYILSARLDERWAVPALVLIQILWTNTHGYFFLGIVFVVIGIISEFLKRRAPLPWQWSSEGRLTDAEYRKLRWALLFLVLATFINPLGIQGALYPLTVLKAISGESKIFFANITELQRPITWSNLWDMMDNWPLRLMIFLSLLTFVFNRRRIDISAFFFWLFFLVFGLLALRNMVYFAIAAYLVMMVNASNLRITDLVPFKAVDGRFVQITGTIVRILLIVYLVNYGEAMTTQGYYDFDKYERKSEFFGIDLRNFPQHAADFLVKNHIKGRFFNDFNSGAYLIGRAYPNVLVYMDGRTELRGPKFFETYRKIWDSGDEKLFDKEMKRLNLTGAFINTAQSAAPDAILRMFANRKDFKVVYFDFDAVIFLRDIPENTEYIKKFGIDLSKWKTKKLDLRRFGPGLSVPYQNAARANSLLSMGYSDQAMAEADAALEVDPSYGTAHKVRGRIFAERKDWENMFRSYRLALVEATGDTRLRSKLAIAYLHLGELDYAIREADKIIERSPDSTVGYFVKAKVLLKKKSYKKAYDIVLQALTLDERPTDDLLELGDTALEDKAYVEAGRYYRLAVEKDGKKAKAHEKLGRLFKEQGDVKQAVLEWKKSLALNPDNGELRKLISEQKSRHGGK
jgi:tetratricopeptide (TPR) repeat protein